MATKTTTLAAVETEPKGKKVVTIAPPAFQWAELRIKGTAPLVINNFSQKGRIEMLAKHMEGSKSMKGVKREPKNPEALFNGARHLSREGWDGIPANSFRNALISACRLVGFKMTIAKLSLFIEEDGRDVSDGTPLVKITSGKPHRCDLPVKNDDGSIDIRVRPMWDDWTATVRVRYDSEMFSVEDVTNLLARVGMQVGLCEGRPDSKNSAGMGWGLFEIVSDSKKG